VRDVDVVRSDHREVVEQRRAEVEVHAVRLARELAQLRAMLTVELLPGCALPLAGAVGARALGRHLCGELVDRPGDRLLAQLAVQAAVTDDRCAALELDQHTGSTRLIDLGLREPDLRRAVGVAI
jgi:hypothetical protein